MADLLYFQKMGECGRHSIRRRREPTAARPRAAYASVLLPEQLRRERTRARPIVRAEQPPRPEESRRRTSQVAEAEREKLSERHDRQPEGHVPGLNRYICYINRRRATTRVRAARRMKYARARTTRVAARREPRSASATRAQHSDRDVGIYASQLYWRAERPRAPS